jgi:hypothetical protein
LKKVAEGFLKVEEAPLPKSHFQEVGLPVDWSTKFTTMGEQPVVISEVKFADGVCAMPYRTAKQQQISKVAFAFKTVRV